MENLIITSNVKFDQHSRVYVKNSGAKNNSNNNNNNINKKYESI